MLRIAIVLTLLLSCLEGASAQSLQKASLPDGRHFYHPTETYFNRLADAHCPAYEEMTPERYSCEEFVYSLRQKWDILYADLYQLQLIPRLATRERIDKFRDAAVELAMKGSEFPDKKQLILQRSYGY